MGRRIVISIYLLFLLTGQSLSFVHFEDMFGKPTKNLKEGEKNWKKCTNPGQIRNGQTVVWGDGLLIEYICDKNFFATGITHGACDPQRGRWTIEKPVCVASGCPDLLPPQNGVLTIDNNGGVATILCKPGYFVLGSKKLYCEDGKWTGMFPMCATSAKVKPPIKPTNGLSKTALRHADESCFQYQIDPPTLPNAVLKTSYIFSNYRSRYVMIVTYSCVGGYKLADPSSATLYCHNSQWGAAATPKCVLEDDPCLNGNGGCAHICVSTGNGRFACTCREGYTLGGNFRSCSDLDECVIDNGGCEHDCHNTAGSFFCACNVGFLARGKTCVDKHDIQMAPGRHKSMSPVVRLTDRLSIPSPIGRTKPFGNLTEQPELFRKAYPESCELKISIPNPETELVPFAYHSSPEITVALKRSSGPNFPLFNRLFPDIKPSSRQPSADDIGRQTK